MQKVAVDDDDVGKEIKVVSRERRDARVENWGCDWLGKADVGPLEDILDAFTIARTVTHTSIQYLQHLQQNTWHSVRKNYGIYIFSSSSLFTSSQIHRLAL
jgi:hypothetical protein